MSATAHLVIRLLSLVVLIAATVMAMSISGVGVGDAWARGTTPCGFQEQETCEALCEIEFDGVYIWNSHCDTSKDVRPVCEESESEAATCFFGYNHEWHGWVEADGGVNGAFCPWPMQGDCNTCCPSMGDTCPANEGGTLSDYDNDWNDC
jgi:hypothetical protein